MAPIYIQLAPSDMSFVAPGDLGVGADTFNGLGDRLLGYRPFQEKLSSKGIDPARVAQLTFNYQARDEGKISIGIVYLAPNSEWKVSTLEIHPETDDGNLTRICAMSASTLLEPRSPPPPPLDLSSPLAPCPLPEKLDPSYATNCKIQYALQGLMIGAGLSRSIISHPLFHQVIDTTLSQALLPLQGMDLLASLTLIPLLKKTVRRLSGKKLSYQKELACNFIGAHVTQWALQFFFPSYSFMGLLNTFTNYALDRWKSLPASLLPPYDPRNKTARWICSFFPTYFSNCLKKQNFCSIQETAISYITCPNN